MKKIYLNYLFELNRCTWLVVFLSFLSFSELKAANVPCDAANLQGNFTSMPCVGCSISNPLNAVDNSTTTYSTLHVSLPPGAYVEQFLTFPDLGNAGDSARVVISFPSSNYQGLSLSNIYIASYNGRNYNNDRRAITSSNVSIKASGISPVLITVSFAPTTSFTRVEVRLVAAGLRTNHPSSVNIYYAFKEIPPPTANDVTVCYESIAHLSATGPSGATLRWYSQAAGGAILQTGNTFDVSNVTSNYSYYVESFKNGCANPHRTQVKITVSPLPASPFVVDDNVCSASTATLVAMGAPGTTFQWYNQAVGGVLLQTGNTFTTPAIFSNITYYVQATNNTCTNTVRSEAHANVVVGKGAGKTWSKVLGGSNNDVFADGVATPDGGYLFVGGTASNDGDISDATNTGSGWVIKTDANGNRLWDNILEKNGGTLVKVILIPTGYLIGQSAADFTLYKLNLTGDIVWKKTYGGSQGDGITSIIPMADGGYLLGGSTSSNSGGSVTTGTHGSSDYWIVKIDADGNKLWDKTFGGSGTEILEALVPTFEGGAILGGSSDSNDGDVSGNHGFGDIWLVKVDALGNKIWTRAFGGSGQEFIVEGLQIAQTSDGNYLLVGSSSSYDGDVTQPIFGVGNSEGWVVKINPSGNILWNKNFDVIGDGYMYSVATLPDGGYLLGGYLHDIRGYWLVRTDALGNNLWGKTYGGVSGNNLANDDILAAIIPSTNGTYLALGISSSQDGDVHPGPAQLPVEALSVYNGWVLNIEVVNCPGVPIGTKLGAIDNSSSETNSLAFPNPFTDYINLSVDAQSSQAITIEVFNSKGIKIYTQSKEAQVGKQDFTVTTVQYEPGIYVFRITCNGKTYSQRVVKY